MINTLMKFNKLYAILMEEHQVIEESFSDILKNPKFLIAAALLLGVTHINYTIPKLREIVKSKITQIPQQQAVEIIKNVPKKAQLDTQYIDSVLQKINLDANRFVNDPLQRTEKTPEPVKQDATSSDTKSFIERAMDYIRQHEGVYDKLYKDIYGNWTIGIGHLVLPQELKGFSNRTLSRKEIDDIFKKDIEKKLVLINKHFGKDFNKFSDNMKIAILDGYFRGDLAGSPKTRLLLRTRKFPEAAKEYLANAEYLKAKKAKNGVAKRMEKNANIIANERPS